jgi:uncharacterized protein DUF6788
MTYEALKEALGRLGYVRPGSLVRRFMPCGKPSCRCMGDPPSLHGPYYQWTLRIRGKTKTIRLSERQAQLCAEWIANHRKLKDIVRRMEAISLKQTDRLLRKAP